MYPYEQNFNNGMPQPLPLNAQPLPMNAPPLPLNAQPVPNVMMDMPEEQMQQQNVPIGYTQGTFNGVQQTATYDLNVPPFDIEDAIMRRNFFRKVFIILTLQHAFALPIMGIFLMIFPEPLPFMTYHAFMLLGFLAFIVMYVFSDYRRYMPVNVMVLAFTTIFVAVEEGINATLIGAKIAFFSQLVVIVQFLVMIAYSKQSRFRFTNINAILISFLIYVLIFLLVAVISPAFLHGLKFYSAFSVVYCVYDVQLMLTGHHGYNMKAEEHIFGVGNIYADMPNLLWRLFRYIILDHFVRTYQFLKKCCLAEVC